MTEDEKRNIIIASAREEFSGITKNISEAFRWYIEAHPEECAGIPATITPREADRPKTILDEYERPKCRKCGAEMFWKSGCSACKGPVKKNQWICKRCGFRRITKDTLTEAISKLERKEAAENA
ncbi:MAG: hypothetical protein RAO92_00710 [Candidatus Euphemobacter frigidus]|nr:hypothetical protein [Candidatus Euphemobacter frigidus]